MSLSVSDQKEKLRDKCKTIRKGLGDELRKHASEAICLRLADWNIFHQAATILTYMPMRTEVDLLPLINQFPEKSWVIPRILPGKDGQMVFHPYDPTHLVLHSFGMAEPASYLPQVAPNDVELVLAPGLAFDRAGWRLGYGGGYYDRFLSGFSGLSVGVVYQSLLFDALPRGEYDVPVSWLVSEIEFFKTGA